MKEDLPLKAKKLDLSELLGYIKTSKVALFTRKDCTMCLTLKRLFGDRRVDYQDYELSTKNVFNDIKVAPGDIIDMVSYSNGEKMVSKPSNVKEQLFEHSGQ